MSSIRLVDDRLEFGEFQSIIARPSKRRSRSKALNLPQHLDTPVNDTRMKDIRRREEQARCAFPSDKVDPTVYYLYPLPTNPIIASQPILPVVSLGVLPFDTTNTAVSLFASTTTSKPRQRLVPLLPKQ